MAVRISYEIPLEDVYERLEKTCDRHDVPHIEGASHCAFCGSKLVFRFVGWKQDMFHDFAHEVNEYPNTDRTPVKPEYYPEELLAETQGERLELCRNRDLRQRYQDDGYHTTPKFYIAFRDRNNYNAKVITLSQLQTFIETHSLTLQWLRTAFPHGQLGVTADRYM